MLFLRSNVPVLPHRTGPSLGDVTAEEMLASTLPFDYLPGKWRFITATPHHTYSSQQLLFTTATLHHSYSISQQIPTMLHHSYSTLHHNTTLTNLHCNTCDVP